MSATERITPGWSEAQMVSMLYSAVTELNLLMHDARRHEIEVTLDVSYDRVLDAHRPHKVFVELKIAKLLVAESEDVHGLFGARRTTGDDAAGR